MYKNSLVSIEDLSNEEIEDILDLAQEMQQDLRAFPTLASGNIMASLFFEASTRTRGSFESAMNRLGGRTITTTGIGSSSLEKGETLADTVRVWSSYSDLIVLRHPWEGAARLAVDYASVPVINAGDGGHEHPTQTLCDLFTLRAEKRNLEGLKVALCGDLKHGRTVHSLIFGLLRFGAELFFVPGEGLDLPEHIKTKIEAQYKRPIEKIPAGDFQALYGGPTGGSKGEEPLDALYMTPSKPHLRTLFEDEPNFEFKTSPGRDVVFYVTRRQTERETGSPSAQVPVGRYPRISKATMKKRFSRATVLHPLPRVDELSYDMDDDHRSKYFIQAAYGVPVRMALISLILELKPWKKAGERRAESQAEEPTIVATQGIECANPNCVTNRESQSCESRFLVFTEPQVRFTCNYCGWEIAPIFYGTQQRGRKIYKPIGKLRFKSQHQLFQFRFFRSEDEALGEGFVSASSAVKTASPVFEVKD